MASKVDEKTTKKVQKKALVKKEAKKIDTIDTDNVVKEDVLIAKKTTAKAGKRSAKAIEQTETKMAKQAHKEVVAAENSTKNIAQEKTIKATRSRLERRSKAYKENYKSLEHDKKYSLEEATKEIIKTNPVKFDATVELHVRLSVDPRQADQNIRDSVLLPAGSGKTIKVAAFVDDNDLAAARTAGADLVGETEISKELNAGSFSFDILIATPSQMPKLGKFARLLGPRGLMPNPKSGTVTTDIAKAISEAKAGKVEYRVDSGGIIHLGIGKVSFKPTQLLENLQAVLSSIQSNRPASIKATYIISAHLSTSMGPSIKLGL